MPSFGYMSATKEEERSKDSRIRRLQREVQRLQVRSIHVNYYYLTIILMHM